MSIPRQESTPRQIGSITRNYLQLNGLLNKLPGKEEKPAPQEPVFVHPLLTPEDFKNSLANYNRHIEKYNLQVYMESSKIKEYNRQVKNNRTGAAIPMEQRVREQIWKKTHKDLEPAAYNEAIEKYNAAHGLQLHKRVLRLPVSPNSEKFFLAFLYQYNAQLFRRKKSRIQLEVHVPGELPQFELYPNKVVEAERDGVKVLPVSQETVRHHRERLEEAGVFLDYQFRGPNRAVKMRFNPAILSITDNGTQKKTTAENQSFTGEKTKKVLYNNVSSRSIQLEKHKVRNEGVTPAEKAGATTSSCTGTSTKASTKAPTRQGEKNSNTPNDLAGNTKKMQAGPRKNDHSEVLEELIQTQTELARSLAGGKFHRYRRISEVVAMKEAYRGAMHQDDFRELAVQDIFRFSASIFAGLDVHPGSWVNAYKIWMKEKFMNPNGFTLSKQNIFSHWMRYIAILKEIKKFAKNHPDWEPTYPSLFFDPARKFKENNSFEYASLNFRLGDKEPKTAQERNIDAGKSLRHKTDLKKAQEQIRRMIRQKITMDELYAYVEQNCNKKVNENLYRLVKKEIDIVTRELQQSYEH